MDFIWTVPLRSPANSLTLVVWWNRGHWISLFSLNLQVVPTRSCLYWRSNQGNGSVWKLTGKSLKAQNTPNLGMAGNQAGISTHSRFRVPSPKKVTKLALAPLMFFGWCVFCFVFNSDLGREV